MSNIQFRNISSLKLLLLFFSITVILSCKKEEKKKDFFVSGDVTIKGKIENFSKEDSINELSVSSYDFLAFDKYKSNKAKIDDNGNFELKFSTPNPQVVWFRYKSFTNLYVEPNSILSISFDGETKDRKEFLSSMKFTGSLSKENTLMQKFHANSTFDNEAYHKSYRSKKTPEAIFKFIDSAFSIKNKEIDKFIKENEVPDNLKNWFEVDKAILPVKDLLMYANFYFRPTDTTKNFKDNFPKFYIDKIENIRKLKESDFVSDRIYTILPNYYNGFLGRSIKDEYNVEWKKIDSILYNKEILKLKKNPVLFEVLVFDKLNNQFKNNDTIFYNKYKKLIDSTFKNTVYEKAIQEKYTFVKNLIENPVLPEKTELLTFATDNAQEIYDEIVKNANGKVIYIDNWATWCAPCKREFKEATPQLKKEVGDNVEFIYLCHQSDEGNYKPTISQYKIQGKHYFMTEVQTKNLIKLLNIKGFPTYNIIDKKGKLIHSGFEFRPSRPNTKKFLQKLIDE